MPIWELCFFFCEGIKLEKYFCSSNFNLDIFLRWKKFLQVGLSMEGLPSACQWMKSCEWTCLNRSGGWRGGCGDVGGSKWTGLNRSRGLGPEQVGYKWTDFNRSRGYGQGQGVPKWTNKTSLYVVIWGPPLDRETYKTVGIGLDFLMCVIIIIRANFTFWTFSFLPYLHI